MIVFEAEQHQKFMVRQQSKQAHQVVCTLTSGSEAEDYIQFSNKVIMLHL